MIVLIFLIIFKLLILFELLIIKWGSQKEHIGSGTPKFSEKKKKKRDILNENPNICGTDYEKSNWSISSMTSLENIKNYIIVCMEAPPFYIPKDKARAAGYTGKKPHNLQDVCPKKAIGGDEFKNKEQILPPGEYLEFDINYSGLDRGAHRLAVTCECVAKSEDKMEHCEIYSTIDHYKNFSKIF